MAARITVTSTADRARADGFRKLFEDHSPNVRVGEVGVTVSYTIDAKLSKKELEKLGQEFANPIAERFALGKVLAPEKFAQAIEVGFLPGVTDNVGATARQMIENALRRKFRDDERVYSSYFIFLGGTVSGAQTREMAAELYNPLIERATVIPFSRWDGGRLKPVIPAVHIKANNKVDTVDLEVPDEGSRAFEFRHFYELYEALLAQPANKVLVG